MGSHDPFGHLKHKLMAKKKPKIKLAIWFLTTKSPKLTDFLMCRWCATYCWKDIDESYNFGLNLISIKGLHAKLWAPKSWECQLWEFRDSHLRVARQNVLWMWASWRGTKHTIGGKVVSSPKSKSWWILWVRVCPWFVLAPKVFQLCINQLVVWFCAGPCE